jgi:hypothetical protein
MLSTDPIDFLLNASTGDVVVPLAMSTGIAAVAQACQIAMATIAGEWFLDLDHGVPYFPRSGIPASTAIFAAKFDPAKAVRAFRTALTAIPNVTSIVRLDVAFAPTARALTVTWAVRTTFGDTPVDSLALGL